MTEKTKEPGLVLEMSAPNAELTGYTKLSARCVCCNGLYQRGQLYRNEDVAFLKSTKPLCPNCVKFLKKWSTKNDVKLAELEKQIGEAIKILNEPPKIDCPMEDAGNDEFIGFIVDFTAWLERLKGVLEQKPEAEKL